MGNKHRRWVVGLGMNTILSNRDLAALIEEDRKANYRDLIERGVAPHQATTRSVNKARRDRRPGHGSRGASNRRAIQEG